MKKRMIINIICLLVTVVSIVFYVREKIGYQNLVNMIQSDNEYFQSELMSFSRTDDLDSSKKSLVDKAVMVSDYILENIKSQKHIKSFSFSELCKMIDNDIWIDGLSDYKGNSIDGKKMYMLELYGIVIDRYLQKLKTPFLSFTDVSVAVMSEQDTIENGEEYRAKIYLLLKDLTSEYLIEFEDGTSTYANNVYREVAHQKGLNEKKGNIIYNNGFMQYLIPIEIKYYVK